MSIVQNLPAMAAVLLLLGNFQFAGAADAASSGPATRPPFSVIEQSVKGPLQAQPNYRDGDLISRGAVAPLFAEIQKLGWTIPDAAAILAQLPGDGDFLVKELSSPKGQKFMRKIAGYPQGFDRVERLSQLPDGRQTVSDLIRGKDGYKMVEYLATSSGGKNLGKMVGRGSHGVDINEPTGRIYTAKALIERLKRSYDQTPVQRPATK